jgi:uncharacterized membrane protein
LGWLAVYFGLTLRAGQIPLIERIARVGDPDLTPALCRYTRRLTVIWCAYFVAATGLLLTLNLSFGWAGAVVWSGTVALFVGERWLRPHLFPGHDFPGLRRQLQDTWTVWRHGP